MSSREGNGEGANNANQACAACRHQRKRCSNCPLAPYFPSSHNEQFQNVHKHFGVSNVLKILKSINKEMWPTAVETIKYEADVRKKDPVHGCAGIIHRLKTQIEETSRELERTNQQVMYCRQIDQTLKLQHQLQLQNMLGSSSVPMQPMNGYHYQSPNLMNSTNEAYNIGQTGITTYAQPFQGFEDVKPFANMAQTVTECNRPEESSGESVVGEMTQVDQPSDINLKNVAECSATRAKGRKGKQRVKN